MKIEILVYSYLAVCLAMIGFNIVCIFLFRRNDRETEHRRLYYINLIKGQFGKEELDESHRLLMLKRLTKVRELTAFDKALENLNLEYADFIDIFEGNDRYAGEMIRYATDAICWSQVPENLKDLSKQRRRWHIGLFQSMWKHRIMLANTKFGLTSFISYFYLLIYELLSPFIEIFGIATTILAFMVDLINVPFMLLFFGIYALFGSVIEKAPMGQDQAAKN